MRIDREITNLAEKIEWIGAINQLTIKKLITNVMMAGYALYNYYYCLTQ